MNSIEEIPGIAMPIPAGRHDGNIGFGGQRPRVQTPAIPCHDQACSIGQLFEYEFHSGFAIIIGSVPPETAHCLFALNDP